MEPLIPGFFYHIFNRANGNDKLFIDEENYCFFMEKYQKYLSAYVDTYAFCLIPNHFHFLIRLKDIEVLEINLYRENISQPVNWSLFLSKQFSKFFSSYTQSYNKMYQRRGSLFMKNFKRKRIDYEEYLLTTIKYIHNNPVNHGLVDNIELWRHSSYNTIISRKSNDWLKYDEVLDLFDDRENFIYCHR